jgi:hypothetical protein
VTLTAYNSGASIFYTTDGSTPSETAGNANGNSIKVASGTTITIASGQIVKAIAYNGTLHDSTVTSVTMPVTCAIPTLSSAFLPYPSTSYFLVPSVSAEATVEFTSNLIGGAPTVAITSPTGGSTGISYTTNGTTTPTETGGVAGTSSTVIANGGAVTLATTTTLKAIAFGSGGGADSAVGSYKIYVNHLANGLFSKTNFGTWSLAAGTIGGTNGGDGNSWYYLTTTAATGNNFTNTFYVAPNTTYTFAGNSASAGTLGTVTFTITDSNNNTAGTLTGTSAITSTTLGAQGVKSTFTFTTGSNPGTMTLTVSAAGGIAYGFMGIAGFGPTIE